MSKKAPGPSASSLLALKRWRRKEAEEENAVLIGFLLVPVFRVQDAEGDPLEYESIQVPKRIAFS